MYSSCIKVSYKTGPDYTSVWAVHIQRMQKVVAQWKKSDNTYLASSVLFYVKLNWPMISLMTTNPPSILGVIFREIECMYLRKIGHHTQTRIIIRKNSSGAFCILFCLINSSAEFFCNNSDFLYWAVSCLIRLVRQCKITYFYLQKYTHTKKCFSSNFPNYWLVQDP